MERNMLGESLHTLNAQPLKIHKLNLVQPYDFECYPEETSRANTNFYIKVSTEHLPQIEVTASKRPQEKYIKERIADILSQKSNSIYTPSIAKLRKVVRSKAEMYTIRKAKAFDFVTTNNMKQRTSPCCNTGKQKHKAPLAKRNASHAVHRAASKNLVQEISQVEEIIRPVSYTHLTLPTICSV
eukprot:TRINITY_DN16509_c0_g1_i2.p1 TRINITY_DN16509_c0_g1~~TRINITY_DN16509_c0_g1_i2.p1  ORF type:complete len:184 (+),score=32.99 TRINITY_DN16509_c0_g1_i2:111-662(+)